MLLKFEVIHSMFLLKILPHLVILPGIKSDALTRDQRLMGSCGRDRKKKKRKRTPEDLEAPLTVDCIVHRVPRRLSSRWVLLKSE